MSLYKIGTCSYCDDKNKILRPSPFMADRKAMMCKHCWNETKKEYAASNEEYIPDFNSNKDEYESIKNSVSANEDWIVELTESDSEIWSSDIDCNSRKEAIEEGMKAAKEEGLSSFRIGRQEYCSMAKIDASTIIENAQEQLYNEVGEVAETYLEGVTEEQEKELEEALNEVFHSWHKRHKLFPNCYMILDNEVIEVEQSRAMDKFPILGSKPKENIPWDVIKTHENQALINHGQTLKRLAERGGLGWVEALCVLENREYDFHTKLTEEDARIKVLKIIKGKEN